jgi:hypothetical protein
MHDELTMKNHHIRRVGAASLPEIHHNVQNQNKSNFCKDKNLKKKVSPLSASAIGERIGNFLSWWVMMLLHTREEVSGARCVDAISIQLKNVALLGS